MKRLRAILVMFAPIFIVWAAHVDRESRRRDDIHRIDAPTADEWDNLKTHTGNTTGPERLIIEGR